MKKLYSLIAAAALGSVISASAFVQIDRPMKKLNENFRNIEISAVNSAKQKTKGISGVQSRAGEEAIDITTFTQSVYYDYFFNYYIDIPGSTGQQECEFRNLRSAGEIALYDNGNNTFTMANFGGYDVFNPTLYITNQGELVMKAGEALYTAGRYTYYVSTLNSQGAPVLEGDIPFTVYSNGITTDIIGVLAVETATNQIAGWQFLYMDFVSLRPNATLKYTMPTQTGITEINNRIYVEYFEADPDASEDTDESWDRLSVSNITPFNAGVEVNLLMLNDDMMVSLGAIAMESQYVDQAGTNSGDFYFSYLFSDGGNVWFDNRWVFSKIVSEYDVTWPHESEGNTESTPTSWGMFSEIGYGVGDLTEATLTLDHDNNDGIHDIITDNNADAPAAYYNFQGMQIANPVAGQAYIVKKGNNVSKQIIK